MIKLKDFTPEVYYKESRDFQFIGRLFDLVLNSVKTEADILYNLPAHNNTNEKLLNLLALTLGFKPKHQYNSKQLQAICKVFPEILRNKGSIKAITIACSALFNAAGAEQTLSYDFTPNKDKTELNLYIPQNFNDVTILTDLLEYILPAGISCNIIRELQINIPALTEVQAEDKFNLYKAGDMYDLDTGNDGTNYIKYDNNITSNITQLTTSSTDRKTGKLHISDAISTDVQDKPGYIMNTTVYKPEDKGE
jgi:hypothetical protein